MTVANVSSMSDEARERLYRELRGASDLASAIRTVLGDQTVFEVVSRLPEKHGLWLGHTISWDDTNVYHHYGLTIDTRGTPQTCLYGFDAFHDSSYPLERVLDMPKDMAAQIVEENLGSVRLGRGIQQGDVQNTSVEGFAHEVNQTLRSPDAHLVRLYE